VTAALGFLVVGLLLPSGGEVARWLYGVLSGARAAVEASAGDALPVLAEWESWELDRIVAALELPRP